MIYFQQVSAVGDHSAIIIDEFTGVYTETMQRRYL